MEKLEQLVYIPISWVLHVVGDDLVLAFGPGGLLAEVDQSLAGLGMAGGVFFEKLGWSGSLSLLVGEAGRGGVLLDKGV